MPGLFTLDSATLGVLDTSVLGGDGTGFVTGSNTSSGNATGTLGHSGSVAGASTSSGVCIGSGGSTPKPRGHPYRNQERAAAFVGSCAGVSSSSGRVSGAVLLSGSVRGVGSTSGSGDGRSRLEVKPITVHFEGFVSGDLSEAQKRRIKDERELELIGAW